MIKTRPFQRTGSAWAFIFPLVAVLLAFTVIPVIGTVANSLRVDVPFLDKGFAGLGNYGRLLGDSGFWRAVRFTLLFVFVSVSLEMVLGMALALVLNERMRFSVPLKVAALLPWAVPIAIAARAWQLIYNYHYGLANLLAARVLGGPVNWLGTDASAFGAVVLADVWKTTPFVAIILLAGLKGVPEEVLKQARIDGANWVQRFFKVTFPLIVPVFLVALLFRTIDALRVFDILYVLTGGGPGGSTTSVSLYAYRYFLMGDFGYGSAVSFALFIVALTLSILYTRAGRFREVLR